MLMHNGCLMISCPVCVYGVYLKPSGHFTCDYCLTEGKYSDYAQPNNQEGK